MSEDIERLWEELPENERRILNCLNRIQAEKGFVPRDTLIELADRAGVPESQLHGLVSFFEAYRTRLPGRHLIRICCGTACYARGAPLLYDRLAEELDLQGSDTSPDGFVTVEQVYCVGACSQAPVVIQDGAIMGRVKSYQVPLLLAALRKKE